MASRSPLEVAADRLGAPPRIVGSRGPARIVMVVRGGGHRGWRIIDAFVERTGLEARRSHRVAEFLIPEGREVQVVATLTDIDHEWAHHVDVGPLGRYAS